MSRLFRKSVVIWTFPVPSGQDAYHSSILRHSKVFKHWKTETVTQLRLSTCQAPDITNKTENAGHCV